MGKVTRGALWVAFPPAGIIASYRAGARKRQREVLDAIQAGQRSPEETLQAEMDAARVKPIAEALAARGITSQRQRLLLTIRANELCKNGATLEQAVDEVLAGPLA